MPIPIDDAIRTIEYRELRTGPGYNNRTIGITVAVQAGEDPDAILDAARQWVSHALGIEQEIVQKRDALLKLESMIRTRTGQLDAITEQLDELKVRLERITHPAGGWPSPHAATPQHDEESDDFSRVPY